MLPVHSPELVHSRLAISVVELLMREHTAQRRLPDVRASEHGQSGKRWRIWIISSSSSSTPTLKQAHMNVVKESRTRN